MRAPTPLGSAIQHALPSLFCLILFCLYEQVRVKEEEPREMNGERRGEREREREKELLPCSLRSRDAWRCLDSIYTSKAVKGDIMARPDFTRCRLVHRPGGWYRVQWSRMRDRERRNESGPPREVLKSRKKLPPPPIFPRFLWIVLIVRSSGRCRLCSDFLVNFAS